MKNIRSRSQKLDQSQSNPSDFVVSTESFLSNEKEIDLRWTNRHRHNYLQMILLILTAFAYLIHTLRAYIPADLQSQSHFWSSVSMKSITRVYSWDFRPIAVIESLILRLTENWQAFSLCYVLSYIPRRTHIGYLYRIPDVFNTLLCSLLLSALIGQTISQFPLSVRASCGFLCVSVVCLLFTCRLVTMKLVKYEEKYRSLGLSMDLLILRYFVLNSLFLYTMSVCYSTVCACVEWFGLHSQIYARLSTATGLTMILVLLIVYSLLDLCVYQNEFRSIWTPYLFIAYVFLCPPLRPVSFLELDPLMKQMNTYLLWLIFVLAVFVLIVRFVRQLAGGCRWTQKKIRLTSHIEQISNGMAQ